MPKIYYNIKKYTGNYVEKNKTSEQELICKKSDLYRAIITVGNPCLFSFKKIKENGLYRELSSSIFQKVDLVKVNIKSENNKFCLHQIFYTYVSDQKRLVSYNLGMAMAKLYADRIFKIHNLIHVESLTKGGAITFTETDNHREPDLVGHDEDGLWHVFEAKGMSYNQLNSKVADAKEQAQKISMIHGQKPETNSVCATYFGYKKILSRIEDPEINGKKEISIDIEKYYDNYYAPFTALKEDTNLKKLRINNIDFSSFDLHTEKCDLTIGLNSEIIELLMEKKYGQITEFYKNKKLDIYEDNISVGLDGYLVQNNILDDI
ncbi:hypothetical protein FACS1894163_08160 [Spirochaetia bacterium]|nr:hypothetical protein FACS1894163_08160 [Spirochaetia bacterium]